MLSIFGLGWTGLGMVWYGMVATVRYANDWTGTG
jgi:hypothetical protein